VLAIQGLIFLKNGGGGIRTPSSTPDTLLQKPDKSATEIAQSLANTDTYKKSQSADFEQNLTVPEHSSDTILHQKCALCVPKNQPNDLKELINIWPQLPDHIKSAIRSLVHTCTAWAKE
jgi:hypothetical protein